MFEKFMNTGFVKERCAQDSEYFKRSSSELELVFNYGNQAICCDGRRDLYSNGILRSAPKRFNVKVLLDPLEEEFNLPPVLVKKRYLGSINFKVVREVYEGSLCSLL